jgi:hypothetical protein
MILPFVVTVTRRKRRLLDRSGATLRKRQRRFLRNESNRWLIVELLLFGIFAAISAWPIIRAIEALRLL